MGAPDAEASRCRERGNGSVNSDAVVIADPVSETFEPLLVKFGLLPEGMDGVRECRISNRVARETGWTSGIPFRNANVFT